MQKGFIQIPLLIAIITSVILGSVLITGGVMIRQGKLKLTANVSDSIKQESSSPTTEPIVEPIKESPEPTKKPVIKNESTKPIIQTPTSAPVIIPTIQPTIQPVVQPQQNVIDPDVQAQIDALKAENERIKTEQARQAKCAESDRLYATLPPIGIDPATGKYYGRLWGFNNIVDLYNQTVKGIANGLEGIAGDLPNIEQYYQNYLSAKSACGQ